MKRLKKLLICAYLYASGSGTKNAAFLKKQMFLRVLVIIISGGLGFFLQNLKW